MSRMRGAQIIHCPACHETNMERMRTGKGDMVRDLWYASTGCPYHGKIEKDRLRATLGAEHTIQKGEKGIT